MKEIRYLISYNEHPSEFVTVWARNINSGFPKAARLAARTCSKTNRRELHSVEFSEVR